jgi:hypothetical protein
MVLVAVVNMITTLGLGLGVDVTATSSNINHDVDTTEHMMGIMMMLLIAATEMMTPVL